MQKSDIKCAVTDELANLRKCCFIKCRALDLLIYCKPKPRPLTTDRDRQTNIQTQSVNNIKIISTFLVSQLTFQQSKRVYYITVVVQPVPNKHRVINDAVMTE